MEDCKVASRSLQDEELLCRFYVDLTHENLKLKLVMRDDRDGETSFDVSSETAVVKAVFYKLLAMSANFLANEYQGSAGTPKSGKGAYFDKKIYFYKELTNYYTSKQRKWEDYIRDTHGIKVIWTSDGFEARGMETNEKVMFPHDAKPVAQTLRQLGYLKNKIDFQSDFQIENYPIYLLCLLHVWGIRPEWSEESNDFLVLHEPESGQFLKLVSEFSYVEDSSQRDGLEKHFADTLGSNLKSGLGMAHPLWQRTFGKGDSSDGVGVLQTGEAGYLVAARSHTYETADVSIWLIKTDSSGNKEWDILFNRDEDEWVKSVDSTADGGFIVSGFAVPRNEGPSASYSALLIIKIGSKGEEQWRKMFGASGKAESGNSVRQAADGGFIIVGRLNEKHDQVWLIKLDAQGNKDWDRVFPSGNWEEAHSVIQTRDGGYAVAGETSSPRGEKDVLLIRSDANGRYKWSRTFGGVGREAAYAMLEATDGGIVLAGKTSSYGISSFAGHYDFWVLKTDSQGNVLWKKTFGDYWDDTAYSICQASDGGYVIAGESVSAGYDLDGLVVKIDSDGNEEWRQVLGGEGIDSLYSIHETHDGGYLVVGSTSSYGDPASKVWLVKICPRSGSRPNSLKSGPFSYSNSVPIAYAYDGYGRLTAMTDNEADTTTYEYDNLNRMTLMSSPWAETTLYDYDGAGRLTHRTNGNATTVSYAYDETGRLTSLVNRDSASQVISSNSYALDGVGNRLSNTTQRGTDNYYYDVKYQLTSATHPTLTSEAYAYDAAGNRTVGHGYTDWAYNVNNQLTGYNGVTYGYDANGNMTSATDAGGTTSYSYDYENRLVQVNFPGSGYAAYKYDGQGRRIEKSVNGVITRYLYNGSDPIAEYDGAGVLQAKYLHGRGWGEPLAMLRGEAVYWYHGDGLGSVTEVTDSAEDVIEQYVYDSFGNLHVYDGSGNPLSQTAIGNCFTYIGREYDNESDLYYLRARYYSPEQGRFLSRDPLKRTDDLDPFLPLDLYTYSSNNPVSKSDPYGLKSCQLAEARIKIDYTPPSSTGYSSNPAKRSMRAETYPKSRNCGCIFIQEMIGEVTNPNLPENDPNQYKGRFWGLNNIRMNFSSWVVDSYEGGDPKYRHQGWMGSTNVWQMTDAPQAAYAPTCYRMDFRIGVYSEDEYRNIRNDGHLNAPPPLVTGQWSCKFMSDSTGTITQTGIARCK